jgi:hypothetical protein
MSDYEYKTEATNAWYAKAGSDYSDRPSVSVWMPRALPSARLETVAHGCHEPDTLREGPAIAYVTISGVQFGGYLDELELLFDAVHEQITNVRGYHDELRAAEQSGEQSNG